MSSDTPASLVPGGIRRKPVPDAQKRPPSPEAELYDVLDDYYDEQDSNPPPYSLVEQPREHLRYQAQNQGDTQHQAQERPRLPPKAATTPLLQSGDNTLGDSPTPTTFNANIGRDAATGHTSLQDINKLFWNTFRLWLPSTAHANIG
ncbi:uncharacterized protein PG986_002918 [Apiospora aurea]|uniref:Uncharacterized protein n=1 Tax=Apiospora aurea TaxID=335848 RepID=A0ABR1QQ68_9PEZI